jgi:hypothetical protein
MGNMNGTTKDTKGWDLFKLTFVLFVAFVVEKHFLKRRFSFSKFLYNRRPYLVARPRNRLFKLNHERKF